MKIVENSRKTEHLRDRCRYIGSKVSETNPAVIGLHCEYLDLNERSRSDKFSLCKLTGQYRRVFIAGYLRLWSIIMGLKYYYLRDLSINIS